MVLRSERDGPAPLAGDDDPSGTSDNFAQSNGGQNLNDLTDGDAAPVEQSKPRSSLLSGTTEDTPFLAAVLMIGSLTLLGLQDGLVKLVSSHVSLWQFQFLRASTVLGILIFFGLVVGHGVDIRPKRIWAVLVRSLFLTGALVFFFGGAPFLPLSQMAAGLYTFPLFVTLLAWLFLGEQVGPRRVFAIGLGFVGTLLIIQPWDADFSMYAVMPIIAALCYAGSILTTRKLCRTESPITLAYGVNMTFVVIGLAGMTAVTKWGTPEWYAVSPYLFGSWIELIPLAIGLIVATAVLNLIANLGLAKAYQSAEPSWLAPFDYSYLIFATAWGFVLFGNVPDTVSIAGMVLIASSGTFVAWRERQDNRRRRANAHRALR